MSRLYTATIRPYLKNRSLSFFSAFGIPTVYIDGVVVTYAILFFTLRLKTRFKIVFNPLNAELSPICHLLALLGAHHILHVSGLRVNLKKLNELEVRKQNNIDIMNRFAALGKLSDGDDINRAWENIKENIKIAGKESLGLHELKQRKICFDEECLQF